MVMMRFDPRDTAHHEAAHAVIYIHFDVPIEEVTLYQDGTGLCSVSSELVPSEGQLLAILAGAEADKLLLEGNQCKLDSRKCGWGKDNEHATAVFVHLGGNLEDARRKAAQLVKEKWQIIRALAELWIQRSEADYVEGENQYCMEGTEVMRHVARFSGS
jgi:hypothetical protein